MIVTRDHVLNLIKSNPKWANWFPYVKGLDFQETQERRVKEKLANDLSYLIENTMTKCEASNGNSFAMDVWRYCAAELAKMSWGHLTGEAKWGKRGGFKVKWNYEPIATWKHRIYRNASLKAEKERGFKPIQTAVDQVASEILRQREIA